MESSTVILISKDPGLIENTKQWAEGKSLKIQVYSPHEWEGLNPSTQSMPSFKTEVAYTENIQPREQNIQSKQRTESHLDSQNILPFPQNRLSSPSIITDSPEAPSFQKTSSPEKKVKTMDEIENKAIQEAIHEFNGNLTEAAKALGIGRATLYRKVKQYRIDLRTTRRKIAS